LQENGISPLKNLKNKGNPPSLTIDEIQHNSRDEQDLAQNYMTYILGKIVPGLMGLISVPVFIQVFNSRVYGEFSLIYSAFLLFLSISTGWLNQGLIRFYSAYVEPEKFLRNIYHILFYNVLILLIPGIAILKYFNYSLDLIFLLIITYFFASYNALFIVEYQAKFLPSKIVISDAVRSVLFLILPVTLFYFKILSQPLMILFCGVLFGFLVGNLFFVNIGNRKKTRLLSSDFLAPATSIKRVLIQLWTFGWPLSLWFVFATLLNISDRYLISYFLDLNKVGEYSAIYDLMYKSLACLLGPLLTAIHPRVVKYYNEGNTMVALRILRRAIIFELGIFVVIMIILYFFKDYLAIRLLGFGDETKTMDLVMPIFIGSFLWHIAMLIHKPMELKKQTKPMLIAVLIALTANIIGNILLMPIYGLIVAAYTTIMGSAIYLLLISQSLFAIFHPNSTYLLDE